MQLTPGFVCGKKFILGMVQLQRDAGKLHTVQHVGPELRNFGRLTAGPVDQRQRRAAGEHLGCRDETRRQNHGRQSLAAPECGRPCTGGHGGGVAAQVGLLQSRTAIKGIAERGDVRQSAQVDGPQGRTVHEGFLEGREVDGLFG